MMLLWVVIDLVSASKLKNDFIKYEKDELKKLSNTELTNYRDSLVIELMKPFKNGTIYDNADSDEINDLIDSYMEIANKKFINAETILLDRKFRYLVNAYFTANVYSFNRVYDLNIEMLSKLILNLIENKLELKQLLILYHDNYSNRKLLNELFYNLSAADGLPITFEIHEKYLNNEFGVNCGLMMDLDYLIKLKVEKMFELFERIENNFNVDEISDDDYFDKTTAAVKDNLKNSFSNINDFEKTALINSGYDTALFHQIENAESEIDLIKIYANIKEWFMNLYNGNGFAEISAKRFEMLNKNYPDTFDDFDEYMEKEPKYDLKKCKFIKPDIEFIAY